MDIDKNKTNSNNNDNNLKIIEKDGFKFIDEDDNEPIILYENFIHGNEYSQNSLNSEELSFSDSDDNFQQVSLFSDDLDLSNDFESTNDIDKNNQSSLIQTNIDKQNNFIVNQETNNQNQDNITSKDLLDEENNIDENFNKFDSIYMLDNLEQKTLQDNNNQHDEIKNNVHNSTSENDKLEKKEEVIYFVKPTDNTNNKSETTNNYVGYDDVEKVNPSFFKKYVVISDRSLKKLVRQKYCFNIIYLLLWAISLITLILFLIVFITSKFKPNSKIVFNNWNFIPLVLFTILSGILVIYHATVLHLYSTLKKQLNYDKKIDEDDYKKIKKIYKQNKINEGILLWFLLTISILFAYSILIIFCVHKFDVSLTTNSQQILKEAFYSILAGYVFIMTTTFSYFIGTIVTTKTIEHDDMFKLNKHISTYKAINKKSYKIGLIIFLSVTIIGIIIYGIVDSIIKRKYEKEYKDFL